MKIKKITALAVILILIAGWVISVAGVGGKNLADRMSLGLDMIGGVSVVLEADTDQTGAELKSTMEQVQAVMERRVNELGLSEPVITIENENRIRIELPGAEDAQAAIDVIGRTAQLTFKTADDAVVIDGSHVKNAVSAPYQGYDAALIGTYTVELSLDSAGNEAFTKATQAIVNNEIVSSGQYDASQIIIYLDEEVISDPMVSSVISSADLLITGNFTQSSAANLAALIRGGSLPVTLNEVQTDIVGPTLGLDAARTSLIAGLIGVILIFIIMIVFYRIMGVVADIALALYILIVAWTMAAFHAVLTLPGIAGIILSVGMAVDSNVIIFCRIKEEIGYGKSVRVAVQSGFKRALSTIIDSQVTTVIAAVILFEFGTGSVRGFAMTLLIGIIASIFTAVFISQLFLTVVAEIPAFSKLSFFGVKNVKDDSAEQKVMFPFLEKRKVFYIAAAAVIVLGIGLGLIRGFNLGIDFTGGTKLQINLNEERPLAGIKEVLDKNSIIADIQYAGENNEKIIVKTTQVISNDMRDALFADLADKFSIADTSKMVEEAGLIGPSVGSQLKTNAVKSMLLAAAAMLIYIAIRFEWRFGIASIMALCHDGLMLFALYGIFHIQMNSPFIAGLLIVIGYSINDTIVIFDRIRENLNLGGKRKLDTLINASISQCVSRSIMTSVTTIVAIIPFIIMCGESVRAFALPLIAGVAFGTVSSLLLASGFYYDIRMLTKKNKYRGA